MTNQDVLVKLQELVASLDRADRERFNEAFIATQRLIEQYRGIAYLSMGLVILKLTLDEELKEGGQVDDAATG